MSQHVLPVYLVCDGSSSMAGTPIEAVNDSLPHIHDAIGAAPEAAGRTRLCVIGFSHEAQILMPLRDPAAAASAPALTASGGTSYAAAFDLLRAAIASDVASLRADGHQVCRPAVFFLSDGHPNDDWPAAHRRLTDSSWASRPHIVAFGLGQADGRTIRRVATVAAYLADGTAGPPQALRGFAQSLIGSMVSSAGRPPAGGWGGRLDAPALVPGFTMLPAGPH